MSSLFRLIALFLCCLLSSCATQITQTSSDHERIRPALKFQRLALTPKSGAHLIKKEALEVGDIVLTANDDSLISFAIRLASMSPVSHAAIFIGEETFVEAIADGVHQTSIDDLIEHQTVIAIYRYPELTDKQRENLRATALAGVGKRYNYIGVALQAPFMLTRRVCEVPLLVPGAMRQICYEVLASAHMPRLGKEASFCSQYVLDVYQRAGVPLTEARPHWISPRDLMHMREDDVPAFMPHLQLDYVGHLKQAPLAMQSPE